MTLRLTDREHYGLQQFFLQWAPGIPPIEVRKEMLGLPGTCMKVSCDNQLLSVNKDRVAPEFTAVGGMEDNTASSHSEDLVVGSVSRSETGATTGITTLGTSFRRNPLAIGLSSDKSTWEWTSDDERGAATQAIAFAVHNQAQENHSSLEQIAHNLGDLQLKAPGIVSGLTVTSVDSALRCIQEVKCSEDVQLVIDAIAKWAAAAGSYEKQEFNRSCETYPYIMWIQPYSPQLDYSELLTVLPYIKQDYKQDWRKSTPYINLEAAHFFGIMWAKLYGEGILALNTYSDGLLELVRSNTYAHWDILDTILTTRLSEPIFNPEEKDLAQHLIAYRDHVRGNKLHQLDGMDSEGWY